ncbi:helix-turn-helix transcriptional regulator [Baekduia alba]|uniref:helix-turn-helix transcriptional regulator n=1 Tax=Baekduia alba TaxID=2997333 RepID=UPI0023409D0B|nr:helix-turn-helix transcriptional regulator [Baekduia alba]
MAATTISSSLIGRDEELSTLMAAVHEADAGRPTLAFVAGESGVGKSRLLSEFTRRAREEAGAKVLSGECVELGDGELPYAPLVGALRPLVRAGDPGLLELPAQARFELGALLPGLAEEGAGSPGNGGGSAESERRSQAQSRLFEALLAALDRLARDVPVVLIIEDVHWADRSTRDFLSFLGRNLADERVLVAMSYRPDELHRRHPLRPLLAVLERTPQARRIELRGLRPEDVRAMAVELTGHEPSAEQVERLIRRSDGNALFVEELLAAGPGPLPPSLADALMVRVERLPPGAQEVVRVLSVAQPADHPLLEALAIVDDATLRAALRDAIAGHVVAVDHSDRYVFRHVLLREVVYDDLLPGERSDLHLAVARALESKLPGDGGPGLAAAVAHHFHRAGDQPQALRSAILAADAAVAAHAEADAAQFLERALELWERVVEPEALTDPSHIDHVDLLMRTSRAHRNTDDARRATLINEALREARAQDPDDPRVPVLLQQRAMAEWGLGRGEASRASLDLARRLLADDAPIEQRISLTISRMKLATLQSRYGETTALAEEVLPQLPEGRDGEILRSETYNNFGLALIMTDRHEEGVAALRESTEIATRVEDYVLLGIAFVNLADALQLSGLPREAREVTEEGLRKVEDNVPGRAWLPTMAAELAIDRGDYDDAAAYLRRTGRTSGNTRVNVELRRAELALCRGDDDVARDLIEEVEALLVDSLEPQFVAVAGVLRAEIDRRSGHPVGAREAVESALERLEFCSDDTVRLGRLALTGVAVEADVAQRARDLGDASAEADAIARAGVMLSRAEAAAAAGRPLESAYHASARAQMLRACGQDPGDAWTVAAARWEALDRPLAVAVALWRAAEACLARGRRDGAAEAAGTAVAGARRLGAAWLVSELEGLIARARLTVEPGSDGGGAVAGGAAGADGADAGDGAEDDPFGLTPRERQVLTLVARGATNREIGAELFMAEKTASVHVSRILAKLDVRSRTEAAAVAHRLGLTSA